MINEENENDEILDFFKLHEFNEILEGFLHIQNEFHSAFNKDNIKFIDQLPKKIKTKSKLFFFFH